MNGFIRILAASAAAVIVVSAAGAPASAQGMADDTDCVMAGLLGEEFGLCNAYCEAMDCDSTNPQASAKACEKVRAKFEAIEGAPELPCLGDPTNAKPEVDLSGAPDDNTFDTTATFVSFADAVPIALDVEITDDGTVITSATITLKNPVAGENETLALTPEGLILLEGLNDGNGGPGTSNFDSASGILLITGEGDLGQYEDLIQQVVYDNADDSPSMTEVRLIDVTVSDGEVNGESNIATSSITVEVGCPCTTISQGILQDPSHWLFYSRVFQEGTRSAWVWEVGGSSAPTCSVAPFGEGRKVEVAWGDPTDPGRYEATILMEVSAGAGLGQCLVSLQTGVAGLSRNETLFEWKGTSNKFAQQYDPPRILDVFTDAQGTACQADYDAFIQWFRAYFETRGATCTGP